jgi:hypothetical protein
MGTVKQEEKEETPEEKERQVRIKNMPILEECYNLMDFEAVARHVMKKTAWAYYSSGADDEIVCPIIQEKECRLIRTDHERKSLRLPQNLVSTPRPR